MKNSDETDLLGWLAQAKKRSEPPNSSRILDKWVAQVQSEIGGPASRLVWLVGVTVAIGVLQRPADRFSQPYFLVKGGTSLQLRFANVGRLTKDLDGSLRDISIESFIDQLDIVLKEPWGPLEFRRRPLHGVKIQAGPEHLVRFDLLIELRGVTWRRIPVDVSGGEGYSAKSLEQVSAPSLDLFGLPSPEHVVVLGVADQIAEKIHAVTAPHEPPALINNRARDLVDLYLLRRLAYQTGSPSDDEIAEAIRRVFSYRAEVAAKRGLRPRLWPTSFRPPNH
jgi:hypothetical protein